MATNPLPTLGRRSFLRITGGAAAGAASASSLGSLLRPGPVAALTAKPRFVGDPGLKRLYYGATTGRTATGGWLTMPQFEAQIGMKCGTRRSFAGSSSDTAYLVSRAKEDIASGRFPMLSIKPPGSWQDVAQGVYNAWLDALLDSLAALNAPMSLTVHHEPDEEVDGVENTPIWHRKMTDHIHARALVRAPKVTIVQILMRWTFDPKSGRRPADWVSTETKVFGVDMYNPWELGTGKKWLTFEQMIAPVLPFAGSRPIFIPEQGSRTDPADPAKAERWMNEALTTAANHNVACMAYFHVWPAGITNPYALDQPRLAGFKKVLGDPRTIGG